MLFRIAACAQGYSDACRRGNQLNLGIGVRGIPESRTNRKSMTNYDCATPQKYMNYDSCRSREFPLRYLRLKPDCEGLLHRLRFRTGQLFPSSETGLSWQKRSRGSRPSPIPGPENSGTPTAVASLVESLWGIAINNGRGSRSWSEQAERRQQTCCWKMQVTSAFCPSVNTLDAGPIG